jgi:tetratricopeptide (TPR) repeat protein
MALKIALPRGSETREAMVTNRWCNLLKICAVALMPTLGLAFISTLISTQASAQTATTIDFGPDIEDADNHRANLRVGQADAAYQRALAKSPNSPTVLVRYASFKRTLGDYDEAIQLLNRAEEAMVNGAVLIGGPEYLQLTKGITFYRTGTDYDAAAAIFQNFLEEYPDAPAYHLHLAFSEIGRGDHAAALANLERAEELFGDRLIGYRAATLALGYAYLDRTHDVMRLFSRLQAMESVSEAAWAAAYVALGDYGQALGRLELAITNPEAIPGATNNLYFLADNPFGDPALEGPRFQELFGQLRSK